MNKSLSEAIGLTEDIAKGIDAIDNVVVLLFPPFPYLEKLVRITKDIRGISVGAQNCSSFTSGAYTGEVSAQMLTSCGVEWVLLGHSERRILFNEHSNVLKEKLTHAFSAGLRVIWCCGELKEDRQQKRHFEVISQQLKEELGECTGEQLSKLVIAYEPVWAIGTGLTASPEQAQEMHLFIRSTLSEMFGKEAADATSILYGGSCNPANAASLFTLPDVDGGLIGGASLHAEQFLSIISSIKA